MKDTSKPLPSEVETDGEYVKNAGCEGKASSVAEAVQKIKRNELTKGNQNSGSENDANDSGDENDEEALSNNLQSAANNLSSSGDSVDADGKTACELSQISQKLAVMAIDSSKPLLERGPTGGKPTQPWAEPAIHSINQPYMGMHNMIPGYPAQYGPMSACPGYQVTGKRAYGDVIPPAKYTRPHPVESDDPSMMDRMPRLNTIQCSAPDVAGMDITVKHSGMSGGSVFVKSPVNERTSPPNFSQQNIPYSDHPQAGNNFNASMSLQDTQRMHHNFANVQQQSLEDSVYQDYGQISTGLPLDNEADYDDILAWINSSDEPAAELSTCNKGFQGNIANVTQGGNLTETGTAVTSSVYGNTNSMSNVPYYTPNCPQIQDSKLTYSNLQMTAVQSGLVQDSKRYTAEPKIAKDDRRRFSGGDSGIESSSEGYTSENSPGSSEFSPSSSHGSPPPEDKESRDIAFFEKNRDKYIDLCSIIDNDIKWSDLPKHSTSITTDTCASQNQQISVAPLNTLPVQPPVTSVVTRPSTVAMAPFAIPVPIVTIANMSAAPVPPIIMLPAQGHGGVSNLITNQSVLAIIPMPAQPLKNQPRPPKSRVYREIKPKIVSNLSKEASSSGQANKDVGNTVSSQPNKPVNNQPPAQNSNTVPRSKGAQQSMTSSPHMTSRTVTGQPQQQASASKNGNLNLARRLVANITTEDLLVQDSDGDTYLHVAVCRTECNMVHALLERFIREGLQERIDMENNNRQTPLYLAVAANQPAMVRLFINCGADVNVLSAAAGGSEVKAAIHCAAAQGLKYLATLKELLKAKDIDLNKLNREGQTALHCAIAQHGKGNINSVSTVAALLEAKADPNVQDQKNGMNSLMYALMTRDPVLLQTMIQHIEPVKLRSIVKASTFSGKKCQNILDGFKPDCNPAIWEKLAGLLKLANGDHTSRRYNTNKNFEMPTTGAVY